MLELSVSHELWQHAICFTYMHATCFMVARSSSYSIFICLGRQTKQIMVAKIQTLMLLIANAESSPLFCVKIVKWQAQIFKQNSFRMVEDF
jgi:hypothetical protein